MSGIRAQRETGQPRSDAPGAPVPFEQAAAIVLGDLQHAMAQLLAAAPGEIRKAADVERALGINHLLGWQIYRIAHAENPLAAGSHIPARVSMKKLLTAAARRRVPGPVVQRVSDTFDAFERLAEANAEDRDELGAMLSAFIPEEARKQSLESRRAAFRAMSQIKGLATETDLAVMFFHPSSDGRRVDRVSLNCEFGLRRVRPDAPIVIGSGDATKLDTSMLTLDGRPCDGPVGMLLPEFCTSPLPRIETHQWQGSIFHCVTGRDVGMRSAVDLVMADRREGALPMVWEPGTPHVRGPAYTADSPVKRATLDVFLHESVFPGVIPGLWVYDTVSRGQVRAFDDPAREYDKLITHDAIRPLPAGVAGARLPHIPAYSDMLRHVYATTGWDAARFRGFRLDVQYPIYGAQYLMGFRIPLPG